MTEKKDNFLDKVMKVGLFLGSIWLGPKFLKAFSGNQKNEKKINHKDKRERRNFKRKI